jgi:hypothetical protein
LLPKFVSECSATYRELRKPGTSVALRRPNPELNFDMATQDLGESAKAPAIDRSQAGTRSGSIGMVVLVALALVGAAVGLLLVGRGNAGL